MSFDFRTLKRLRKLARRPNLRTIQSCAPPKIARHQNLRATQTCTPPKLSRHPKVRATQTCAPRKVARYINLRVAQICESPKLARHPKLRANKDPRLACHLNLCATQHAIYPARQPNWRITWVERKFGWRASLGGAQVWVARKFG